MKLTGLHLLLTYECNHECDHCFTWGSPEQDGTMTLEAVREILRQATEVDSIEWIYFEGGEPFLYYAVLSRAVEEAAAQGFRVGIVSNGYWATAPDDALLCLSPFAGRVQDLSVSSDLYHWSEKLSRQARHASAAAREFDIPVDVISIAQPEEALAQQVVGKLPPGESAVRYRGRAAVNLAPKAPPQDWRRFGECPCEDLREPGRVHVDPLGNLHVCQGIVIGNLFAEPLSKICTNYDPESHPVVGPLLAGGPVELVRRYEVEPQRHTADACHLCYYAREALRLRFPGELGPDQMYGAPAAG